MSDGSEWPTSSPDRNERLERILADVLNAEAAGSPVDRDKLLSQHPELADDLASFFRNRAVVERFAEPLRQQVGSDDPTVGPETGAGGAARGPRVRYFGDYELLQEIARGGMGIVYRAKQVSLNRLVALKMILKAELATEADVRRFRQEAEAAANLDHPNIVPIYEVGEHEGQQYFSMKLIELAPFEPRVAFPTITERVATVARAVHHAHQRGILHRDLKPSNILIDKSGAPHVADFGLAKRMETEPGRESGGAATRTGSVVGTPAYMAPEQARAEKSLTTAVDVYSLGAILYEWLTGRPPFRGDDPLSTLLQVISEEPVRPRAIDPAIDRDLETICLKCLDKEPAKRYPSAAALADDLDRWLRGEPIGARAAGQTERLWRWCRRNPVVAGMAAAVLTLLVAVAIGSTVAAITIAKARDDAHEAEKREAGERRNAEDHADDAKKRLARQYVGNAARAMDDGDLYGALPWLVEALRQDEGKPDRERMQRFRIGMALQECPKLTHAWFPPGKVIDLNFTDGRLRAVVSDGLHARVWDALTGQPLSEPLVSQGGIQAVAFRGDGRRLMIADPGRADEKSAGVHIVELPSGKRICTLEDCDPGRSRTRGAFTPDGKRILVERHWMANPYHSGGDVAIWDAETGKKLTPAHKLYLTSDGWLGSLFGGTSVMNREGTRVATLSGAAWVWDAHTGKSIPPADSPLGKGAAASTGAKAAVHADFSPDGSKLVVGFGSDHAYEPGEVGVWDIATGAAVAPPLKTPHGVVHVAWSANGKSVQVMSADSNRWQWNLQEADATKIHLDSVKQEQPAALPSLSPNGIHTVVVRQQRVFVWNMATNQAVTPTLRHEGVVRFAIFDDEGCRLATAGEDMPVRVFDFGGALPTVPGREFSLFRYFKGPNFFGFSPDGRRAVLNVWSEANQLWDLEAEKPLGPARYFIGYMVADNLPPERTLLIEMRQGSTQHIDFRIANLVDGSTARVRVPRREKDRPVNGITGPDGHWLLTFGGQPLPQLWDAHGRLVATLKPNADSIVSSPTGQLAVGFDEHDLAHAWELPSGRGLWSTTQPRKGRSAVEFTKDGKSLLVASTPDQPQVHKDESLVEVWDTRTGHARFEPIRIAAGLATHCLSPDGAKLFTIDLAGHCQLWSLQSGQPLGSPWKSEMRDWAFFSQNSERVFLARYATSQARLWEPATGKPFGAPVAAWNSWRLSPDGRMVHATFFPGMGRAEVVGQQQRMRSHLVEAETGLPLTPHLHDNPFNDFHMTADGRRMRFMMDDIVHQRELVVEDRAVAELRTLAAVLSGHQIDESESLVSLDRVGFEKSWKDYLAQRRSSDVGYSPRQRHEWHVQAAVDCLRARCWDGANHPDGQAWGGALHHLNIALRHKTDSGMLHFLRAQCWENLGDEARMLADLDKAIALEPRCRDFWEKRAALHLRRRNLPLAEADFAQVIGIGTDEHRMWHQLALLRLGAGKTQAYRELCTRMLDQLKPEGDIKPEDALWTCSLAPKAVDPVRLAAIVAGLPKIDIGRMPKSPAAALHRAGKHADAAAYQERYLTQQDAVGEALTGAELAWSVLIFEQAGRKKDADQWRGRAGAWQRKEGQHADWADRAEFDLILNEHGRK